MAEFLSSWCWMLEFNWYLSKLAFLEFWGFFLKYLLENKKHKELALLTKLGHWKNLFTTVVTLHT